MAHIVIKFNDLVKEGGHIGFINEVHVREAIELVDNEVTEFIRAVKKHNLIKAIFKKATKGHVCGLLQVNLYRDHVDNGYSKTFIIEPSYVRQDMITVIVTLLKELCLTDYWNSTEFSEFLSWYIITVNNTEVE